MIEDAKRRKGVRGNVFYLGGDCHAFYLPEGRAASIFHDGDHLHVSLVFESRADAMSFQTALQKFALQNPLLGLTNALKLDRVVQPCTVPAETRLFGGLQDSRLGLAAVVAGGLRRVRVAGDAGDR